MRPSELVALTWSPMQQRNVSRRGFEAAAKAAGLRGVTFYSLRHTFASHLIIDLGLDVVQVSRQLGHASPAIALTVYAHLFDQARRADDIRSKMEASDFGRLLDVEA